EMPEHDGAVWHAQGAGRVHIFEVSCAQELRANHADEGDPGEEEHDAEQDPETGRQHRRDYEDQVEDGDGGPDFDKALEKQVSPSAKITLYGSCRDADHRRKGRQHKTEEHGNAEAVNDTGKHVARLIVGAEPVPIAYGAVRILHALRITLAALFLRIEPG